MKIKITLKRDDLIQLKRNVSFEKITLEDFNISLREVSRANSIVFIDDDTRYIILKSRSKLWL